MTALVIRDLDPRDDAAFHAFHEVYERAHRHRLAALPVYPEQASRPYYLQGEGGRRAVCLVALADGLVVGQASAFCPPADSADVECVVRAYVDPLHTRRGVGGALVAALVARLREMGQSLARASVEVPPEQGVDDGYVRFARRHGWVAGNQETVRRLALPLPPGRSDELRAEAAAHHQGYALRTCVGPVPDELVEHYVALDHLIDLDAPTGDLEVTPAPMTVGELRASDAGHLRAGSTRVLTLAWSPDGEAVASTNLIVQADGLVRQGGTIVRRDHRGHRLGLAVKLANLATVQQQWPHAHAVQCQNADLNQHMVAVNDRLGFVPVASVVEMQRRL